jgi:hypothetical protein
MGLRENAAAKAGRTDEEAPPIFDGPPAVQDAPRSEPLPDVDVEEPGPDGPEKVPVHVAWSRVMGDVRKIAKGGEGNEYTGPGSYSFRGAERTLNAFGPVLRKHGVLVLPVKVEPGYRDTRTSQNKPTKETTVVVSWMVIGPEGDQLPMLLQSAGEALDSSDKGTAKAQTVAQRVLLLTAAQVPTGDPDPDSVVIERGEAPVRSATSYRDEVLEDQPGRERMRQIVFEIRQQRRGGELVTNENGDQEAIGTFVERIGKERFTGGSDA